MRAQTILSCVIVLVPALCTGSVFVIAPDGSGDYPTIQAALDAAAPGDVIELTDGTFAGEGNRDLDFQGKPVTVRSQSGDPELCVVDCEGSPDMPHRGFLFVSGESGASILQGVKIYRGIVSAGERGNCGGGMLCVSSSPTVKGCVFETCGVDSMGGAVACFSGSSPTIEGCRVDHCWAYWGAGIGCAGGSSPAVHDSRFWANFGVYAGGALLLDGPCTAVVTGCLFDHNSTKMPGEGSGAGILCRNGASATVERCTFTYNSSSGYGGSGVSCVASSPDIAFCTFWSNEGAPLQCASSSPTVRNCTLVSNWNAEGSAIRCEDASSPALSNCIAADGHRGPPVFCADALSAPTLSCCDLHGNDSGDWTGCVAGQLGVDGNIALDPLFCDPAVGDFTLAEDSPCAAFSPPNPGCDLIGAWPVACGPTGVGGITWGAVKALFVR